jgi:hypothetical protein
MATKVKGKKKGEVNSIMTKKSFLEEVGTGLHFPARLTLLLRLFVSPLCAPLHRAEVENPLSSVCTSIDQLISKTI